MTDSLAKVGTTPTPTPTAPSSNDNNSNNNNNSSSTFHSNDGNNNNNDDNNGSPANNDDDKKTTSASSSKTTKRKGRWQQARAEEDPIIAPGYGRRSDLQRLAHALNRDSLVQLPVSAVEALMKARGRGMRSSTAAAATPRGASSRGDTATSAAATPVSSAWADFMKEEGVSLSTSTATAGSSASHSGTKQKESGQSDPPAVLAPGESRNYLPLPWDAKSPPAKKARSSNEDEGHFLLQSGTLDVSVVGRTKLSAADFEQQPYHLARPTWLVLPQPIQKVFAAGHAAHAIAIDASGQVYGWGRNEAHQLGGDLPTNVYWPTVLPGLQKDDHDDDNNDTQIVQAATGKSHTLLRTSGGRVYAVGSNKFGQCGMAPTPGVSNETVEAPRLMALPGSVTMAEIACGEDFSVAVSTDGHLYSTGCSQYGQLGNGETGEYFIAANKLAFSNCAVWTRRSTFCHGSESDHSKVIPVPDTDSVLVRHVACGKHHTLVVEAAAENVKPRIFSFGCGDYGCLGHGVQKDEYYPRQIAALSHNVALGDDNQIQLAAGNSCSLLCTSAGHVYYWGKHRSVGEAVMRPVLNDVLANNQHVVRHVAAGSQTIVCTTEHAQTVASGQGPHGELGLKSGARSSAKLAFVDDLNGCHVQSLAATYGSLLYVVRKSDESIVKQLAKLEADDVLELTERLEAPPVEKGKRGRKRKS